MSELGATHWRRARLSINTAALSSNLNRVRDFSPDSQIMAVIKANAYGHGMLAVAKQLDDAQLFAVAMPAEAYALRAAGCSKPVLVLHGFSERAELEKFADLSISTVIHQSRQLEQLLASELSNAVDVWLKVDTGMHRLGIPVAEVDACFGQLRNSANVAQVSLMSHFANADNPDIPLNNSQLEGFIKVTNDIEVRCSMANSAAIMRLPDSHFDVVRPGIMLYGSSPFTDTSALDLGLQAVMQFESELIDIKQVAAGESIGYGSSYTAERDITMAVVAAGYADGYPRHAKNGTPVWLKGRRCDLLGRVSMDSLCIDVSRLDVDIGERVVLWGKELPE